MTTPDYDELARQALLRCINKPLFLEAYQPEIARAIREAVEAEARACVWIAEESSLTINLSDNTPMGVVRHTRAAIAEAIRSRHIQEEKPK